MYLLIVGVGVLAWYPTLNFWFFKAYEATWLMGVRPHNIVNLMRGHAFLYYLDWKIFGWNPWGWYLTSLALHIVASLFLFYLVLILTNHKMLSFIASLLFVASTSYIDVLTWGSFNSYYPLLMIWMLSAFITFYKFKETKKIIFLFLSVLFSLLGFFTRETGILIVIMITIFDLIFSENLRNRQTMINIFKRGAPFYFALLVFFIVRSWYGGVAGDTADSNVKMQIRFVHDRLFFEYATASLLTFGKLVPPHIIPYPLLNTIRKSFDYGNKEFINTYFFSILGFILFAILSLIILHLRRNKYFRLLIFFFIWVGLFSLFVSLTVPNVHEVLTRDYEFITMRYRYFAFAGTSIIIAGILIIFYEWIGKHLDIKKAKKILFSIVSGVVIVNLLFIWEIEKETYISTYKPAKEFYKQFNTYFPTLPKEAAFYIYPHASGLSDYLLEWYFIKDSPYPNLRGQPFRIESQIGAVLSKIKEKKMNLDNTFFLDYDSQKGLLNKTKEVRNLLLSQQNYSLKPKKNIGNNYNTETFDGVNVETPYDLQVTMASSLGNFIYGKSPNERLFKALVDYNLDRKNYLDTAAIKTAPTMSQRPEEPFLHVVPENLIDGNVGERSSWIADAIPAWMQVDLSKEIDVYAAAWGSQPGSTRIPATYSFFSSNDEKTWTEIKTVKNNSKPSAIDIFDKPIRARYIKMVIDTTDSGDFAKIDELEVISSVGKDILTFYNDRDKLLDNSRNMFQFLSSQEDLNYLIKKGLNFYWAKLLWETNTATLGGNNQFLYFPYSIDRMNQKIIVKLPEAEIFAGPGQFLNKHITSIALDFGEVPFIINVINLQLLPRLKI